MSATTKQNRTAGKIKIKVRKLDKLETTASRDSNPDR
jgi:hypothetical protein